MTHKFEVAMVAALDEVLMTPAGEGFDSKKQHVRVANILSALRGHLTEEGTTWEQDCLLFNIGVVERCPEGYFPVGT